VKTTRPSYCKRKQLRPSPLTPKRSWKRSYNFKDSASDRNTETLFFGTLAFSLGNVASHSFPARRYAELLNLTSNLWRKRRMFECSANRPSYKIFRAWAYRESHARRKLPELGPRSSHRSAFGRRFLLKSLDKICIDVKSGMKKLEPITVLCQPSG